MTTYTINRKDGAQVTTYQASKASIHQADDGSWMAWADMVERTNGGHQLPVSGGIHIRRGTQASLLRTLKSGRI